MEQKHIPSDLYRFSITIDDEIEKIINVYTEPNAFLGLYFKDDYAVQKAYFDKEKIEELKKEFIKKIQESENPFRIFCFETDSDDYNITEDQIFRKQ